MNDYTMTYEESPQSQVIIVLRKGQKLRFIFSEGGYGVTVTKTCMGVESEQIFIEPGNTNKITLR